MEKGQWETIHFLARNIIKTSDSTVQNSPEMSVIWFRWGRSWQLCQMIQISMRTVVAQHNLSKVHSSFREFHYHFTSRHMKCYSGCFSLHTKTHMNKYTHNCTQRHKQHNTFHSSLGCLVCGCLKVVTHMHVHSWVFPAPCTVQAYMLRSQQLRQRIS